MNHDELAVRYENSLRHTQWALACTPGGSQTMSKAPARFPQGAYPAYLHHGRGANVWDVDGNKYVDWICGLGAVPLGYAHEGVTQAIQDQLGRGLISASLPTTLEGDLADRLIRMIPCTRNQPSQIRFVKTGSEACAGAIRIARRATKRDCVIVAGYHGWHDWVQAVSVEHPGIPNSYRGSWGPAFEWNPCVIWVPYNDATRIESLMREYKVAAVMLEPALLEFPTAGYLQDVVTLCTLHGAISIFDEMVCGFRWARGGGQEYFGVTSDMAVFGKGLANGMPLACIAGPQRLMRYADVISGTFGGECLSLAAAGAVLDAYEGNRCQPVAAQWEKGNWFLSTCRGLGIPAGGYPVHPRVLYEGAQMALFLQETARRGLLVHPAGFNVSAALTPTDLDETALALKWAKDAMDKGVPLVGKPLEKGAFER